MINKIASAFARYKAGLVVTKNEDAARLEGKYFSLEANDYVDIPTCEEGYTFSLDTYRCEPNE